MADALVTLLNKAGYQPVFLPRTGLLPPELYNFANGRLIRRGALSRYVPGLQGCKVKHGELADISGRQTSGKKSKSAVSFLENALRCVGITSIPKLDISFAGGDEFVFSFTNLTAATVDPADLDQKLSTLVTGAIPDEYLSGALHIVYEYLYSSKLLMSRGDGRAFAVDVKGKLSDFIDLGLSGAVNLESHSTIAFANPREPAAFAFKAGLLRRDDNGRWNFEPEIVVRGSGDETELRMPYLPRPGRVLVAEE